MNYNVRDMAKQIETIKTATLKLKEVSGGIQSVDKNAERIMASVKMLEINITDLVGIYGRQRAARRAISPRIVPTRAIRAHPVVKN